MKRSFSQHQQIQFVDVQGLVTANSFTVSTQANASVDSLGALEPASSGIGQTLSAAQLKLTTPVSAWALNSEFDEHDIDMLNDRNQEETWALKYARLFAFFSSRILM